MFLWESRFSFLSFCQAFSFFAFSKKKERKSGAGVLSRWPRRPRIVLSAEDQHAATTAHAGQKRRGVEGADSPCMAAIQRVRWGVSGRWGATNGGGSRSRVPHSLRCRVSRSGAGEPCKEEGRRRSRGVPAQQGRDHRERRRQRNFKYSRLRRLASNGGVNTMLPSRAWSPCAAQGGA